MRWQIERYTPGLNHYWLRTQYGLIRKPILGKRKMSGFWKLITLEFVRTFIKWLFKGDKNVKNGKTAETLGKETKG